MWQQCNKVAFPPSTQRKNTQKQHYSQQKHHNRNSTQHIIIVYMRPLSFRPIAVCIGVRTAILHRCSHLAFISAAGIGARTLPFTVRWSYRLALLRVVFLLSVLRSVKTTRRCHGKTTRRRTMESIGEYCIGDGAGVDGTSLLEICG